MPEKLIIKNGFIVDNNWALLAKDTTSIPAEQNLLLPLALWLQAGAALNNRQDIGVWFDSDEIPDIALSATFQKLPVIAINFPVFTDGRGFSIARLLRERIKYTGELRATGNLLRDQLCYMKRCGFNSFDLPENADLSAALVSLDDFTEYYQTSVDQPEPLFRRA